MRIPLGHLNKMIIGATIFCAISIAILSISTNLLGALGTVSFRSILAYAVPIIFLLAISSLFKTDIHIYWRKDKTSIIRGVKAGGYILLCAFIIFSLSFFSNSTTPSIDGKKVLLFLGVAFATGFFEELLYRGIIQNVLTQSFIKNNKNPMHAICTTAIIFALSHLVNLIVEPTFIYATIAQVFYTFAIGIMLGVVYYLSESLWVVIFLHAIFNFLSDFSTVFSDAEAVKTDVSISAAVFVTAIIFPGIVYAYWQYKKHQKREA